jgi:hypothetical protein
MNGTQSGYIFGFIILAFFVYITLKGELPIYAGLLLLSPAGSSGTSGSTSNTSAQSSQAQTAQTATAIVQGAFALMGM